ncbi:phosphatase PAP2 family protein [Pseudonocardia abyssalis]|uniref:Phosphatase PAP2 family protein n=1 Tax=Pseudonocardia abyssalis TaxID=2792008 RepID=A0ABS6UTW3_9PSEU|nr:phosphatase PAP2 family protein [Pseudonocardia abyssalis]MBW0116216.1 phosphatase PAP2 family protein [Pseudonocardia abyssalis]MBW0135697.1 phosphatase PAP2 family protein [Pseudonocardia abyssalis]
MPRPALRPSLRPATGLATAACAALVAALGARYAGGTGPGRLDDGLSTVVERVPAGRGGLAWRVFSVGDPARAATLTAGLAAAGLLLGRPRLAVVALAGPVLTGVATSALKPLVGRRFGRRGEHAFPSGHTGLATALAAAGMLLVVDVAAPRRPWDAVALAAGTVVVGAGTGMALTAIEVHYPTDTVGGAATAVAVVLGTARIVDALAS